MSETVKKKSILKRWWFWSAAALILIIIYSTGNKNNEDNPAPGTVGNQTAANNTTDKQISEATNTGNQNAGTQNTTTTQADEGEADTGNTRGEAAFSEGMYKIGTDLPAGEYILFSSNLLLAYYQVTSDSTGSLESIISNDNFSGNRYISVSEGQYLEIKGSKGYAADKAPDLKSEDGKYTEGMYKVGKDIAAGEYKVIPDENSILSYIEIAKDSKGILESIVTNDNFEAEKYISIKDDQYIKLVGCYIQAK